MKIFSKITIAAFIAVMLFNGCKKNAINYSDFEYVTESQARIKVNYNVAFGADPPVQIKINGVRVSGTYVQTRYPFPGGGLNTLGGNTGDYLPVNPGNTEVSISIPKKGTNIDSVEIYKTTMTTAGGKYYSLHVADTLERKGLAVEDDVLAPDSGIVKYKFTNLMANVPAIDLYVGSVLVVPNIPFMGISPTFTLPISQTGISTTWAIRPAGASPTSTALASYNSSSTMLSRRVYTIFATGYSGRTDAKRKPYVAFYYSK